jgi:nucleotide-binding universal stress UspA family protein
VLLAAIEVTILVDKPHARGFALIVLTLGLAARLVSIVLNPAIEIPTTTRRNYVAFGVASSLTVLALAHFLGDTWLCAGISTLVGLVVGYVSHQAQHYRAALIAAAHAESPPAPRMIFPGVYVPRQHVMVATQGNPRLIQFAIEEARSRQAELQLLFVRVVAITPMGEAPAGTLAEDPEAQALFDTVRAQAHAAGVPSRLIYAAAPDVVDAILDMAVTHGADLLLLGTTRRGTLWRTMKGDVIQTVAEHLPERVGLLIHA